MKEMYNIGDIIVLHPWDKLKELFGVATCDEGHECINTSPILIDRYKSHYEQGMRVNGIFEGLYQTNQCVVPHEAVSHLKKEVGLAQGTSPYHYDEVVNDVQTYTLEYTNQAEADPRGEDREAAREAAREAISGIVSGAESGYIWASTTPLNISTD